MPFESKYLFSNDVDNLILYNDCLYNILAFEEVKNATPKFYMGYSDKEEKEFKNKLVGMTQKYVNANGSLNTSVEDIFNNEMIDGQ